MMNKYITKLTAACSALLMLAGLAACTDEVEYSTVAQEEGVQVYFPSTLPSRQELTMEGTTFTVAINRMNTEEALTVGLTSLDEDGLFSIPESVEFAAGSNTANITIAYNPDDMEYDEFHSLTLSIADGTLTTTYGNSTYSFTAGVPAPYNSLGVGVFADYFTFGDTVHVEIQQNELNPNQYRVVNPYGYYWEKTEYVPQEAPDEYINFIVMEPGNTLQGVTITQEGLVYFEPYCTGLFQTDGVNYAETIYAYHPSSFIDYATEAAWTHSRVLHYNEDGEPDYVQLAPFFYMAQSGYGADNTQVDGVITIEFPGAVIADYSLEVNYMGRYTDLGETNYAVAGVTMGEDVESVRVAMISSEEDPNAAVTAIIDGSMEYQELDASGNLTFECGEDGMYAFVAVTFAENEAQTSAMATFEFTTGGSQWTSLGIGLYTDDYVASLYNIGGNLTMEVEVQESTETPGLYRLVNPYAAFGEAGLGNYDDSRNYFMEINACDPEGVYIPLQNIGLDLGYGFFYVYSMAANYLDRGESLEDIKAAGLCGTLVDGVITFPVQTLLAVEESDMNAAFYGNVNGAFRLELPAGAAAQASLRTAVAPLNRHHSATVRKADVQKVDRKQLNRFKRTNEQLR